MKKPNPEMIDDENPEWTEEDFARARPAYEVLPPSLLKKLGVRGPQKRPTKIALSLRLSPSVVNAFRETGNGWQTRMDAALADWLKTHAPEELRACWRSAFIPQPPPAPRAPPTSSLSIRTAHCAALPSSSADLDLTPHCSAHTGPSAPHGSLYSPSPCRTTGSWHAPPVSALSGRSTCTAA